MHLKSVLHKMCGVLSERTAIWEVMLTGSNLETEEAMRFADDIPSNFHSWVFGERIRPAFLIGRADGEDGLVPGRCLACGTENRIPKYMKHREITQCPFCGGTVEAMHVGRFDTDEPCRCEKVSFVERADDDGTVFVIRYCHAYEYVSLSEGTVTRSGIMELGRDFIFFDDGDVKYRRYEFCRDKWVPSVDNGERIRWSPLQTVSGLERYGYGSHIYPESIDEAFSGGLWSDCRMSECAEGEDISSTYLFEEMPEAFYRYPVTSELVKNGLAYLAAGLAYCDIEKINARREAGEPLFKALGLRNKRDLGNISKVHTLAAYKLYREFLEERIAVTGNDLAWIESLYLKDSRKYGTEYVKKLMKGNTENVHGLIRYMLKETGLEKMPSDNTKAGLAKARKFILAWNGYVGKHGDDVFPQNLMIKIKTGEKESKVPA